MATHIHDDIHFEDTVFDIFHICGNNEGNRHMCARAKFVMLNTKSCLKYFLIKSAYEFDFIIKLFSLLKSFI